ncbi:coproporphyrinogen III oxidase [Tenacibaculum sp. SZ-18]|uniref:EI24 domain-containing protein n=1 Tax=Tenacibaculum sp. SZ-18 TaxID=754423 RepID=UPI000C2CED2D|nr:EI24 domain-containing protein [Tenacibaculum sp. SZ-18]AUC14638.1 coproporphyrinogen III oxidase [Tenacibaculum sp. SZ-18]
MIPSTINAVKAYFDSFEIINKLKLWKYFLIPVIISAATALIIASITYFLADDLGYYIAKLWPWEFGKETFTAIGNFLSGVAIVTIGFILYKHIVLALSSPFMGPVSQKIESHFYGNRHMHKKTSFQESLARGIRISTRNIIRELLLTLVILILGLIPLIGIFSSVLLILVQAYYAGFGNMDYTLERHYSYKDSVTFVKRHRGTAIGNGLIFILFLLIPVIGVVLVLPFSVTAATTETMKKIH